MAVNALSLLFLTSGAAFAAAAAFFLLRAKYKPEEVGRNGNDQKPVQNTHTNNAPI